MKIIIPANCVIFHLANIQCPLSSIENFLLFTTDTTLRICSEQFDYCLFRTFARIVMTKVCHV